MLQVKIKNTSNNPLPKYESLGAAGMDIYAHLPEAITLQPFERKLIPTGLYIELPKGYEAQLRMRSSWALKRGLILPNAPATIDADYRGEIQLILCNISQEPQTILPNDRLAQMVVAKHETVQWQAVEELNETQRGEGGFGSTDKPKDIESVKTETPLTWELMNSYVNQGILNETTKQAGSRCYEIIYTLPNGLELHSDFIINNNTSNFKYLYGFNELIEVRTKEQLDRLLTLSYKEILDAFKIDFVKAE